MTRSPRPPRSTSDRPHAQGWQSRLAAAQLVWGALEKGSDLESAMAASAAFKRLEGADRGFARAMASAALRGVGRIDWALGGMVDRPLADIEPHVLALLRIGAAQLWMMEVAGHAAVSATVEAAAHWPEARRGGGLVNAVLRRASREGDAFKTAPAVSVWPDWLAARLKAALGSERADALARGQLAEPEIDISLRDPSQAAVLAEALGGDRLPGGSIRLPGGAGLSGLPGYADGAWWVQDAAAALPAALLGDVSGKAVADLCAAPGGKAMQLAARGARLHAVEMSAQRATRLRENAARTQLAMDIVVADARTWRPPAPLDAVLLDAPCSALGVIRRHPEGVWRRDPRDMARFPSIQADLLTSAAEMLRPGGRLVYAVCTPMPEEGRDIIAAALGAGTWRRLPVVAAEAAGFEDCLTPEGDLLTAPAASPDAFAQRSDVFYIARLERV